ncbi:hypothetical protein, partial [Burkholderia ubonensis]|uniref:hypothetical protein n=1 Tax=Burkholderia ubonensis TaxID=101571 RepID=UPI001E292EDD
MQVSSGGPPARRFTEVRRVPNNGVEARHRRVLLLHERIAAGARRTLLSAFADGANLSAFLWVRRLNKSLATRLRESLTE